ncbi:haloacid dehalogenase superfamily enzyme, subfamily IA [Halogeometricum borinquense DSM 11551]|uniref:Haloacid dehalogenase superfamily enzyme, subfamily IA n=2 Tax=Halogeometricum borinquense TaxID=60847 RepID=E4NWA9_HALBP|nr:HAD family hydrolase [Halogeometricum borinquense]ADQ69329.1 haloacid dehalogenase superfamily enzyme, subfamily IA [Halogeometricum borinquense DSM 11551]ELY26220.1 haloacid dehalogenase superfamily enzyme, subfamily IA [Halogeometricum borinquense DSM 11551]RYJ19539.1 HAD family hydrolase [Halogeometricum borinquense]
MTTTVYFDLDGTLLDYETPFDTWFERTVPVEATAAITETFGSNLTASLDSFEPDPYERAFEVVCNEYGIDADPEALATTFVDTEVAATRVAPSVRRLVASVAERHQSGILTNGNETVQRRKVETHGLDELVDEIVVSEEVGARKPDAGIFETAKERLPADAFVFVGDSYETDIVPAQEHGFETVYVGDDHRPDATVAAANTEALASLLRPLVG